MNNVTSTLAIAVSKTSDYLLQMKTRRKDPYLRRYLPFHELDNIDENLDLADEKIIKRLKDQSISARNLLFFPVSFSHINRRATKSTINS